MRPTKTIENDWNSHGENCEPRLMFELLLDIRELLSRPGVQNDFGKAREELEDPTT